MVNAQNDRTILGESFAENELKNTLSKDGYNIIDNKKRLVKDSETAISIAEPILFKMYGEKEITSQKHYEIYLINKYWVISGTLPKDGLGGIFLIIIDGRNSEFLKITHRK